jgi:general secretion pathway protein D
VKERYRRGIKFLLVASTLLGYHVNATAESCSEKLFSVTIDSKLSIKDVIDNLADTCGLTVVIKDTAAQEKMEKKLYYVKLKNSTLKGFLNIILRDNDLNYTLRNDKLKISYLITKTFRLHYVAGGRTGTSTASVTIAASANAANGVGGTGSPSGGGATGGSSDSSESSTGISIESSHEFSFWQTVEKEIQRILVGAADGSTHYTRNGETWTGPDGKVWEYNPLSPIINPEAGMITVTGTERQISRVARYISVLDKQLKSQVLIDVRILNVEFDNSTTTGVDWSEIYKLQNVTINNLTMAQKNVAAFEFLEGTGFGEMSFSPDTEPRNAQVVRISGDTDVQDVVKFLSTQGDVTTVSSPRVMTLNNQPALISVGKEVFYKIQSSTVAGGGTGGGAQTQGDTVSSVFAGILLDITPEIDSNGYVTLKINPSISKMTDDSYIADGVERTIPPNLIRRQLASVIKVKDGEHAILGGLITTSTGVNNNKVPLLGDMPLVGDLFKRENKINTVSELVLIITPHIIHSSKSVSLKDLGYSKLNEK